MKGCILVLSIKGGTGKTITSIGTASKLSKKGYAVGLIDADLDSPNLAENLSINEKIRLDKDRKFVPLDWNGIEVFSMHSLIGGSKSLCKTGIEHSQIIQDVILNTKWRDNDFFVVDHPAGSSSDEFKTVRALFGDKILGAVVVTQPGNDGDILRVIDLCSNNNLRILGLVENMAYFPVGKKKYYPLGEGNTKKICEEHKLEFFGQIPLQKNIREKVRKGDLDVLNNIIKKIEELSKNG